LEADVRRRVRGQVQSVEGPVLPDVGCVCVLLLAYDVVGVDVEDVPLCCTVSWDLGCEWGSGLPAQSR
jgi:hypothetical protein